jgi:ketosteroid isomerase-like protein
VDTAKNKDAVLRFLEALRVHDAAAWHQLVTPTVVSQIPPSCEQVLGYPARVVGAEENWKAHTHSRDEQMADEIRYDIGKVVAEDDSVVVFLSIGPAASANRSDFVFHFRMENGRIAEWREHLDTAQTFQHFGYKIAKQ